MPEVMKTPAALSGEIQKSQITRTAEGLYAYDDDAALKLVIDDFARADGYMDQEQWAAQWLESEIILQSPRDGSTQVATGGSRIPRFTLSNHISSIVPKMTGGLFYDPVYFQLIPRLGTTEDITDAKRAIFRAQLDETSFKEEVEIGLEQMAHLGTGIWMRGWISDTETTFKYVRKADPTQVKTSATTHVIHTEDSDSHVKTPVQKIIERPFFKWIDLKHVVVDPGCRRGNIQKAKWAGVRDYPTYSDLDKLRSQPGYDIPTDEELDKLFYPPERQPADQPAQTEQLPGNLRAWIQSALPRNVDTSSDPHERPIMRLQRWDKGKVIEVLQAGAGSILIRNEANPFGKLPFYSSNWRNLPNSFYGQGLGKLIGSDQRVEEAVLNAALNILGYSVKPSYIRKKGLNAPTQQIRQSLGGIIDVDDDVDKAFKIMELPKVPGEAWMAIENAKTSAATTSGANEQVIQGAAGSAGKATGMRSGTGAAAVVQANASRLDGPVERFINQVFVPFLYDLDEMNNDLLPTSVIREILGEEIGKQFEVDHIEYRNAVLDYDVLAGAHLGAVQKMLGALPFYMQMLNSPALIQKMTDEGYEIDAVALTKQFADLTGTSTSGIIKKMAPQKQQQVQANSPAAIQQQKNEAAGQMQDKKFAQEQQLEEQRQLGKAAGEQTRTLLEHSLAQEINPEEGLRA